MNNNKHLIHSGFTRSGCAIVSIFMAVTLFVGAEQTEYVPMFPPPFDKVVHFVYYGMMTLFLAHAIGLRWLWASIFFALLVGAADEWNQSLIAARDASIWDWVADGVGASIFVCAYRWWLVQFQSKQ